MNAEGMSKAKGDDPLFQEFINKNHIKPTKLKLEKPQLKRTFDPRLAKKQTKGFQQFRVTGFIKKKEPESEPKRITEPWVPKEAKHITMMDTLTNSRLGDKIFMYSKVDESSEGYAILR